MRKDKLLRYSWLAMKPLSTVNRFNFNESGRVYMGISMTDFREKFNITGALKNG